MITFLYALAALTLTANLQTPPAPVLSKQAAALQGIWDVTDFNGQQEPGGALAVQFDGLKYSVIINGTVDESGTYALDATKTPWTFDLNIKEGSDAGKLQLGILEMKDNSIRGLLAAPDGTTRPASFSSNDGVIAFVAVKRK